MNNVEHNENEKNSPRKMIQNRLVVFAQGLRESQDGVRNWHADEFAAEGPKWIQPLPTFGCQDECGVIQTELPPCWNYILVLASYLTRK